jgi:hypothetical protein
MTHTISADEVAADLPPEQMLAKMLANLFNDLRAHLEGKARSDDLVGRAQDLAGAASPPPYPDLAPYV